MKDVSYASHRQRQRWLRSRGPRISGVSLFVIGLLVGLAAALYYAWIEEPVTFTQASPARLRASYRNEYILLVSQAYEANGDWDVAKERLTALGVSDPGQLILEQMEKTLRDGRPSSELASLANLARQAGAVSPVLDVFAPPPTPSLAAQEIAQTTPQVVGEEVLSITGSNDSETSSPQTTVTAILQPEPSQVPGYRLLKKEKICTPGEPMEKIEVVILDSLLEPLPGIEVLVTWDGGQDHFFTGFKPELGLGFGDVSIEPGITYMVSIAGDSRVVGDLRLEACDSLAGDYPGGWRLLFQNTDVKQDKPAP